MTDELPPAPRGPQRPRQILQAIGLLWISTGLGFAASFSEVSKSNATLAFFAVMMLTVTSVLTVALWRGRNWARVLYLILVILSLSNFVSLWGTVERVPFEVALEAVSFVADAGSLFLMFTNPGSLWFQPPREQRA